MRSSRPAAGPDDERAAREAAVGWLAGREHARFELERKLAKRGFGETAVAGALDWLAENGLQSDARFAESFAWQRAAKAYGPLRIRAELAERGVERGLIEAALEALEVDFGESARNFCLRRYGDPARMDYPERARRAQALGRRGFAAEHLGFLLRRD